MLAWLALSPGVPASVLDPVARFGLNLGACSVLRFSLREADFFSVLVGN